MLVGIGGLVGLAGMVVVGSASISAAGQRVAQLQRPPSELAKCNWQQARAASAAGATTWRNRPAAEVSS